MCMETVTWNAKTRKNPKSPTKWLKGYKIFETKHNGNVKGPHYGTEIEIGKVVKAAINETATEPITNKKTGKSEYVPAGFIGISRHTSYSKYHAGFHIYPIRIAASLYNNFYGDLYLVEYRRIVAEGTHAINTSYPADCHIALEMKVIRKLDPDELETLKKQKEEIGEDYASKRKRR